MKDLPINRLHTLDNFRDMYHFGDEVVLLCETFANAQDIFLIAKTKKPTIEVTLEKTGPNEGYINFHNNGDPMTKEQFQKYHEISSSIKIKGGGIGFAGIGAKVFLTSKLGGEIFTITGKDSSNFLASRMLATNTNVQYEEISNLSEIFKNGSYKHKYGTTYRVRLNNYGYASFNEKLLNIIKLWWNFALLKKQFTVIFNGHIVEPFDSGKKFHKSFTWKKNKIDCYCWIADEEITDQQRHIVYTVYGKRIMNESIQQPITFRNDYFSRVFCVVDVSHLAKHIRTDKESFDANWETNQTRHAVQKFFVEFLLEQKLVLTSSSKTPTAEIVNEFTKELDILLKTEYFKDLNPFLSVRKQMVPTPNNDGDLVISSAESDKISHGEESGNGNGKGNDLGHGDAKASVVNPKGDRPGKHVEKKSKGIRIIPTDEFPDEKEEAWVDFKQGAICINILHPFYIKMKESDKSGKFEKFNVQRILIEALIKHKNNELKNTWDPQKTLNMYRDLLHKTWSG